MKKIVEENKPKTLKSKIVLSTVFTFAVLVMVYFAVNAYFGTNIFNQTFSDSNQEVEQAGAGNAGNNIIRAKLHLDLDNEPNAEVYFNLNAPKIVTEEGAFQKRDGSNLNGTDLIKKAIEVKDTPYDSSMNATYSSINSTPTRLDCSGLVQWSLASVAETFKVGTVEGFWGRKKNGVATIGIPRSCIDWMQNTDEKSWSERGAWSLGNANSSAYSSYVNNSNNTNNADRFTFFNKLDKIMNVNGSIRAATLKYMGNDINVLKMSDPVTNDLRYWEYYTYDEQGNAVKKELPTGTIVISDVKAIYELGIIKGAWAKNATNSSKFIGHAWIYIGDLHTSNPSEARENLANLLNMDSDDICSEADINKYFKQEGGENTHWRIEATSRGGGNNVIISNIDPDAGYLKRLNIDDGYVKAMGPIWAFQVANGEEQSRYDLEIDKRDENGHKLNISENTFTVTRTTSGGSSANFDDSSIIDNIAYYSVEGMRADQEIVTITEYKAPTGYQKYDKPIRLTITKDGDIGKISKIEIGGEDVTHQKDEDGYYDSDKCVKIEDNESGHITLVLKNKPITGEFQLIIRKVDENGNDIPVSADVFTTYIRGSKIGGTVNATTGYIEYPKMKVTPQTETYAPRAKVKITETGKLSDYEQFDKDIEFELLQVRDEINNRYVENVQQDTIKIGGEASERITENVTIDWEYENGSTLSTITVTVKNQKESYYKPVIFKLSEDQEGWNDSQSIANAKFTIRQFIKNDNGTYNIHATKTVSTKDGEYKEIELDGNNTYNRYDNDNNWIGTVLNKETSKEAFYRYVITEDQTPNDELYEYPSWAKGGKCLIVDVTPQYSETGKKYTIKDVDIHIGTCDVATETISILETLATDINIGNEYINNEKGIYLKLQNDINDSTGEDETQIRMFIGIKDPIISEGNYSLSLTKIERTTQSIKSKVEDLETAVKYIGKAKYDVQIYLNINTEYLAKTMDYDYDALERKEQTSGYTYITKEVETKKDESISLAENVQITLDKVNTYDVYFIKEKPKLANYKLDPIMYKVIVSKQLSGTGESKKCTVEEVAIYEKADDSSWKKVEDIDSSKNIYAYISENQVEP